MSQLPTEFNPSSLVLRRATKEERIRSWRNNSDAWRGKLTVEQWVDKNQKLTRNGRLQYWILTDGSEIYCSAETLQKPVAVRCSEDGKFSKEWSYGIFGVFTPVRYRRRGIASTMMRRLAKWLDGDEACCQFTALWSDVGSFYVPLGWSIFQTCEARLPALTQTSSERDLTTVPLSRDGVGSICERDVNDVISDLMNSPLPAGKHTRLAFLPTFEQAAWHFDSEEYIASKLFSSDRIPSVKGASTSDSRVWCYWVHDFDSDQLTLLHLDLPVEAEESPQTIRQLSEVLVAAQSEATSWNLKQVSIRDPDPRVTLACETILDIKPMIEENIRGNIPCLRWKGDSRERRVAETGIDWVRRAVW